MFQYEGEHVSMQKVEKKYINFCMLRNVTFWLYILLQFVTEDVIICDLLKINVNFRCFNE